MARRISQQDPALALEYFNSGFFTHRSQLFAPFRGIGVNVVQFRDPCIDGSNMEDTDLYEWSRRPGFSIFCSESLPDDEIVNQFYSSRLLTGTVYPWIDTSDRWAYFSPTAITTVAAKTTTAQGYPQTIGNMTYFSDGATADFYKWAPGSNGVNLSTWGLAAPTVAPIATQLGENNVGLGFWQPKTSFGFFSSLLDTNGNIESVSNISFPEGVSQNPTFFDTIPIGAVSTPVWQFGVLAGYANNTLGPGHDPYLFLGSWNFAIPLTATILGIKVTVWHESVSGAGRNWVLADYSVKLVIGGVVSGTEHASATPWVDLTPTSVIYGDQTDLWGLSPTPAQVNTNGPSGFGLVISPQAVSGSGRPNGALIGTTGSGVMALMTIYYQPAVEPSSPGISGENEPNWPTTIGATTQDGSIIWTNYGPIETWYPTTYYPTPIVVLDTNGNLQLGAATNNFVVPWNASTSYGVSAIVSFGGAYWISLVNSNMGVPPSNNYTVTTTSGSTATTQPYWVMITSPITTGAIAPVWNTTLGGTTPDNDYTWENIGPGTGIAFTGYEYVYGFRTVYGHLTTSSPYSNATGPILGPMNGSISSFSITSDVVTFEGNNNFIVGDTFTVQGLTTPVGLILDGQTFVVIAETPSSSFPLTSVAITTDVLTIQAINNLVAGQMVTFGGVGTATFLNGQTVTVLSSGLSGTQFEANFTHANYGPTGDTGTVSVNGSYSANFTYVDVGATADSGEALPLIATITGVGTASPLCNSVATITAVSVTANVVTITAANNFQPGIWVTIAGLSSATFLNGQQFQVIAVDQIVGTENTYFQVYLETVNYANTPDSGTATFNAIEIYRTSDGGGTYLFDGAVTNPGPGLNWDFDDFVIDADLNVLLIAPLAHQNDPPPGAPGSSTSPAQIGTLTAYWQGRIWMIVGNYVYFDAGPDCTNGIPEESWPPGNRFQFAGPPTGLELSADGVALLVYLADRVNVIMGGPDTISFYATDALSNFGISNPNALFRDGSILGQFTTQKQYFEIVSGGKQEIGEHISDYLTANFTAAKTYVTMHRDGLDVGVFLSNGVDQILRYGSNIGAWSVPAFPNFGAGAIRSIETSVGVMTLMAATPNGGATATTSALNPTAGISTGAGVAWLNPSNITLGVATDYATVTFVSAPASSAALRASGYTGSIPHSAVIQGVQVIITGKQTDITSDCNVTITPTGAGVGAETHTFQFGTTNTTVNYGSTTDLWGMAWGSPVSGNIGFDITVAYTGSSTPTVSVSEVQVRVTYQAPGNYLYARDVNSWGEAGQLGENNGTPYSSCYVTIGSITMSQLGGRLFPLQAVVGYFDSVGTLFNNGGSSRPDIWILPNEISGTGANEPLFVQLPEVVQEPPIGQNHPSETLLALRWPVNMMNSDKYSQFMHHLQVKIMFEPENAPNTIKAIAFMESQDT